MAGALLYPRPEEVVDRFRRRWRRRRRIGSLPQAFLDLGRCWLRTAAAPDHWSEAWLSRLAAYGRRRRRGFENAIDSVEFASDVTLACGIGGICRRTLREVTSQLVLVDAPLLLIERARSIGRRHAIGRETGGLGGGLPAQE